MEKPGAEVHVLATYKDYLTFPDDGKRYEILEGEVIVTPAPNMNHQRVVLRVAVLLSNSSVVTSAGEVFIAPCDVVLTQINVVQPDVLFVSRARRDLLTKANVRGAPDLVVEVLSPSTTEIDRSRKFQAYEKNNVEHYWILDPESHELEEYALFEGKYRLTAKLTGPAVFRPRVFPELALELAKVWVETE